MSAATDAHLDLVFLAGEVLSPRMLVLFNTATSLATLFGCGGSAMDSARVVSCTWRSSSAAGTASLAWVPFSGRDRLTVSLERGVYTCCTANDCSWTCFAGSSHVLSLLLFEGIVT